LLIKNAQFQQQNHEQQCQSLVSLPLLTQNVENQINSQWLNDFFTQRQTIKWPLYTGLNRLGFYYQWLWEQMLLHHDRYLCVESEVLIYKKKQTIGAIDFLVYDKKKKQFEHWEVAIKFYLNHQGNWKGTQKHDQLHEKYHRMIHHQLTILDQLQWQQTTTWLPKIQKKRLILQGILFSSTQEENALPNWINSQAIQGIWQHHKNWQASQLNMQRLNKAEWLAPTKKIEMNQNINKIPCQILDENGIRRMIVPNDW
jgi:hypothetical protein